MEKKSVTTLKGWNWRKAGASNWTRCAHQKPVTEIFTDLIDAKQITHPFLDRVEREVQWVGLEDWEYMTEFDCSIGSTTAQDLVFEGLDTIADVYLNDHKILHSENMFHSHRVAVGEQLKEGKNNLRILFKSAFNHGKDLEKRLGKLEAFNGDPSRVYVRKAQYHYGWDWGPVLLSCGPYKEIHLETYTKALTDVHVYSTLNEDFSKADLGIDVTTSSINNSSTKCLINVTSATGDVYTETIFFPDGDAQGHGKVSIDNPLLWNVRGHGAQNRYVVSVSLQSGETVLDTWEQKIGVRKIELIQEPYQDSDGTSFYFSVNNIPVYCSGSNWIPAHNFLTSLSKDDYLKWIDLIVQSNQNMIRVWGGGVYEPDSFYDACDEHGILVWQDFMFACGQYPYHEEFRDSVLKEAKDQIVRLRNFSCMALYCGNNEDYQVAEELHLDIDYNDTSGDYVSTNFPARTAYETDLPNIVKELSPQTPYHPGSPWGGKETCADPTVGDIHQWNVWHGSQEKYQYWGWLAGRFISEFGMLACPDRKTVEEFVTEPSQRYPQSKVMESHCKADGFERRLALYVMENITVRSMKLDDWIYSTQLMQSECIAYAYRCWRREWKGANKRYVGGALVWQINDCYPVSSWSLVDVYGRKKFSYYAMKRECEPIGLGIYRIDVEKKGKPLTGAKPGPPHDLSDKKFVFDVWGINMTLKDSQGILEIRLFDIETGELIHQSLGDEKKTVTLHANKTTEFLTDIPVKETTAIQARLFDPNDNSIVLSRASDFPQPLKHLTFPNRKVEAIAKDDRIELSANAPVKGVVVYLDDERIQLSDNCVDLFPGDTYIIEAKGLKKSDNFSIRYYEQETN